MYDDNENHPLQPFPLVVFCVVFFSNKLNKHTHSNSRSGDLHGTFAYIRINEAFKF